MSVKYAAFKKGSNDGMVPLSECQMFEYEYQAQWFCVVNQGNSYVEIKDDLDGLKKAFESLEGDLYE